MKRWLFVVSILLFLTGCSSSYSLNINENLSYEEDFTFSAKTDWYNSRDELVSELNQGYFFDELVSKYNMNITVEKPNINIKGSYKGNDIHSLSESDFLKNLYNDVIITDDEILIKDYNNQTIPTEVSDTINSGIENINIKIFLPFRIIKHNAKIFDETTNTLYYEIRNNSFPDQINIKFNKDKLYNRKYLSDYLPIIYVIMGLMISIGGIVIYKKINPKPKKYSIDY